jgi:predicted CoA-binding protein
MKKGRILTEDRDIKAVLENSKKVAVLGLSPKPERDSHMVARYLKSKGYGVIPVRPGQEEILGERAYASLDDIDQSVDIVDVFRNPNVVLEHAKETLRLKPKVFWMQLGVASQEAADVLTEAGIDVVMDKCLKVEHARLCKNKSLS